MHKPAITLGRTAGLGAAAAALFGGGYVLKTWYRYGRVPAHARGDTLLDRFMPACEVRERHEIRVAAAADVTYGAALALDLHRSRLVSAIFRGRELLMGVDPSAPALAGSLLAETQALGWRVLAEKPGREIVVGAVTRPWEPDVRFRGLAPEEFVGFNEPGYVKIAWTLAAEPLGPSQSRAVTETRVVATDADARARFRRYWAVMSPGILLIRKLALRRLKTDAERAAVGTFAYPP